MSPREIQLAFVGLFTALSVLLPSRVSANQGDCGQPVTTGASLVATDALRVLTTGVGATTCSDTFDACICDVNNSGATNATDALLALQKGVGQSVVLDCGPNCPPTTTTTMVGVTTTTMAGVTTTTLPLLPGDVITSANVERINGLASPGILWLVGNGMKMKIIAPRSISLPLPYVQATEQFSAQVKLSADGLSVENWVAGAPFPNIDPNDKDVATKIMYNYQARWGEADDLDLRNFDADTGAIGRGGGGMVVERHFLFEHFRRMYFTGRIYLDPKPVFTPNADEAYYKESLHPFIDPFDLKGTGLTYYRYLDHTRQDDTWLYLPTLRRVRRLSSAQRSDALFGQDADIDSYGGFAGNIAWTNWRFLGETTVLASMHAENFPVKWGSGSGDFTFDDVWEKRDVWVVEGVSQLPQYAYSKRLIFVDKEAWVIPYSDIHDQAGQLWKVWVNLYKMGKLPFEGAPADGTYNWEMPFLPAAIVVDIQLQHATRAALPSSQFPGEVGWRFNQGEASGTIEDFFSISALIADGRR